MEFDSYVFSKQPGFVEPEMRKAFKQAVPCQRQVEMSYSLPNRNVLFRWGAGRCGFIVDSMFRGGRAPWGRSEDRCDGAGSEADGAKPPVKPGHKLPVLGVLVFLKPAALVKPPSSGLRINKTRRSPGRSCPAFLMELLNYPFVVYRLRK